ncbi:hypothetical protein L596_010587 [Steinernema carpocapsae]|uniref:Uncharacterized protein n=1 Tax=Steinernema carpocapsae TaxID=34508 RepID=A0A4U5PJE0_STECR|nr:hypothetical protein L596_010587 [Steinernema carpocapsae]
MKAFVALVLIFAFSATVPTACVSLAKPTALVLPELSPAVPTPTAFAAPVDSAVAPSDTPVPSPNSTASTATSPERKSASPLLPAPLPLTPSSWETRTKLLPTEFVFCTSFVPSEPSINASTNELIIYIDERRPDNCAVVSRFCVLMALNSDKQMCDSSRNLLVSHSFV